MTLIPIDDTNLENKDTWLPKASICLIISLIANIFYFVKNRINDMEDDGKTKDIFILIFSTLGLPYIMLLSFDFASETLYNLIIYPWTVSYENKDHVYVNIQLVAIITWFILIQVVKDRYKIQGK